MEQDAANTPRPLRWVMIDNYDSFTYNLVQLFGILGVTEMTIWRNDAITLDELIAYAPDVLVVSPGPCSPTEAGISVPAIAHFISHIPILGVCLGHQSLVHALGGEIVRADRLMHGKTSPVFHDNKGLYADVRNPFEATRYHSLLAQPSSLPAELQVSAKTWEDEIMGVRHTTFPVYGVQYHPESILTVQGRTIVGNFIRIAQAFYRAEQPREGDNDHVAA